MIYLNSCLDVWIDSGIASTVTNTKWWNAVDRCNGEGDVVNEYAVKIEGPAAADPSGICFLWMKCKISQRKPEGGFDKLGKWGHNNHDNDTTNNNTTTQKCPKHMVGFKLQMCSEDVGATNLLMFCSRNSTDYKPANTWDGSSEPCKWGPVQYCPLNYAICGFQYEYEPDQGIGDDASITNVKVKCCLLK